MPYRKRAGDKKGMMILYLLRYIRIQFLTEILGFNWGNEKWTGTSSFNMSRPHFPVIQDSNHKGLGVLKKVA